MSCHSKTCSCCGQKLPDPPKLYDYEVFYIGSLDLNIGNLPFGTQSRTVKAENHKAAICATASFSEHSGRGTRYLAIGENPDRAAWSEKRSARLFELTKIVDCWSKADFVTTPRGSRYQVKEITR